MRAMAVIVLGIVAMAPRAGAFEGVQFESAHVHPIELSADGDRLYRGQHVRAPPVRV